MSQNLSLINEIFEETLQLADENGVTVNETKWVTFMREYIPYEYLELIEEDIGASLNDVWKDRYEMAPSEDIERMYDNGECEICERKVARTRHHLIPRELHKNLLKDPTHSREELSKTISICRMCHSSIHRFFTNEELAKNFHTIETLLSDERMFKYARWAAAQPAGGNRRVR